MSRLAGSTQVRSWIQTESSIQSRRDAVVTARPADRRLTVEEEAALRRHHERRILRLVTRWGLPGKVAATGIAYFKRFYLTRSVLDYNPAVIAACSLYASAKVEEVPIHIDLLIEHIDTWLNGIRDLQANPAGEDAVESVDGTAMRVTAEMVLDEELSFLNAIDFHLICFHPHRSLLVLRKRLASERSLPNLTEQEAGSNSASLRSTSLESTPGVSANAKSSPTMLDTLMKRAVRVINRKTLFSDAMFSHAPALIAIAAVACAAWNLVEEGVYSTDELLPDRVTDFLLEIVRDESKHAELVTLVTHVRKMAEGSPVSDAEVRSLEKRRRELCVAKNDPTSKEFQERRMEEEEALDVKRRKKAVAAQEDADARARQILG